MLGIFIGIAAVVALISLSQGLKAAVNQQFINLGTDKLVIQAASAGFGPPGTAVADPLTKKDKNVIDKVKGVDIAVGRLIRIVQLEFKDEQRYTYAVTMPEDQRARNLVMEANNYKISQGSLFSKNDKSQILIGASTAENLFDQELALRDKLTIQGKEFKISGILKKSGNPQQDSTFVLPEQALRDLLNIQDDFDIIPVKAEASAKLDQVAENVKKALRKSRDVEEGKEDFTVQTPEQLIGTLNNIILIIQGVLVGIAAISLVVGGIGIMNTMYTAVVERTKQIGIMKAVGAKNQEIMTLFLIESGILGFFGGLIGVILGFSLAKLIEIIAFQQLGSALIQAEFSPLLLLGSLTFAFVVGAISGVYPARQAAKLQPVEALRK